MFPKYPSFRDCLFSCHCTSDTSSLSSHLSSKALAEQCFLRKESRIAAELNGTNTFHVPKIKSCENLYYSVLPQLSTIIHFTICIHLFVQACGWSPAVNIPLVEVGCVVRVSILHWSKNEWWDEQGCLMQGSRSLLYVWKLLMMYVTWRLSKDMFRMQFFSSINFATPTIVRKALLRLRSEVWWENRLPFHPYILFMTYPPTLYPHIIKLLFEQHHRT